MKGFKKILLNPIVVVAIIAGVFSLLGKFIDHFEKPEPVQPIIQINQITNVYFSSTVINKASPEPIK